MSDLFTFVDHVRVLELRKHLQQPKRYFEGVLRRFVQSVLQFLCYAAVHPTDSKAVSRDHEFRNAKSPNAEFAGADEPESQLLPAKWSKLPLGKGAVIMVIILLFSN